MKQSRDQLLKDGEATRWMGVVATPICGEYLLEEQGKGGIWGFDYESFYHHTLFVGYNVTNTLYDIRKIIIISSLKVGLTGSFKLINANHYYCINK